MEQRERQKMRDLQISNLVNQLLDIQTSQLKSSERWGFNDGTVPEEHDFFKLQQKLLWVPSEISFKEDYTRFLNLTVEQRIPLLRCLVIFQTLDGAVIDSVCLKMLMTAETLAEKLPYLMQITMEAFHSQSYDLQLRAIVPDEEERLKLLKGADQEEWIIRYGDFGERHILKSTKSPILQLTAQAALEGIGFIALFAVIFYYRTNPLIQDIPGITGSNEMISRDETCHRDYAVSRIKRLLLNNEDPTIIDEMKAIIAELVEIVEKAIPTILPTNFKDLTQLDLINYTKFTADQLLTDLGIERLYNAPMSLAYMLTIGGSNKSNFYERTVTQYSRGDLYDSTDTEW